MNLMLIKCWNVNLQINRKFDKKNKRFPLKVINDFFGKNLAGSYFTLMVIAKNLPNEWFHEIACLKIALNCHENAF